MNVVLISKFCFHHLTNVTQMSHQTWQSKSSILFIKIMPYNSHSFLLPSLSNILPLFKEMCKRSAQFIHRCLFSSSTLVQSVVLHSITEMHYNSFVFRNMCNCVLSVRCLLGEVVILYLVGYLCNNSMLSS